MPTRAEIEAFIGTETGKGVLILAALAVVILIGLRVFGGKSSVKDDSDHAVSPRYPSRLG